MAYSLGKIFSTTLLYTEKKKLLNQQMSSAGIGTAVFFCLIFTDFSVGFTDCL